MGNRKSRPKTEPVIHGIAWMGSHTITEKIQDTIKAQRMLNSYANNMAKSSHKILTLDSEPYLKQYSGMAKGSTVALSDRYHEAKNESVPLSNNSLVGLDCGDTDTKRIQTYDDIAHIHRRSKQDENRKSASWSGINNNGEQYQSLKMARKNNHQCADRTGKCSNSTLPKNRLPQPHNEQSVLKKRIARKLRLDPLAGQYQSLSGSFEAELNEVCEIHQQTVSTPELSTVNGYNAFLTRGLRKKSIANSNGSNKATAVANRSISEAFTMCGSNYANTTSHNWAIKNESCGAQNGKESIKFDCVETNANPSSYLKSDNNKCANVSEDMNDEGYLIHGVLSGQGDGASTEESPLWVKGPTSPAANSLDAPCGSCHSLPWGYSGVHNFQTSAGEMESINGFSSLPGLHKPSRKNNSYAPLSEKEGPISEIIIGGVHGMGGTIKGYDTKAGVTLSEVETANEIIEHEDGLGNGDSDTKRADYVCGSGGYKGHGVDSDMGSAQQHGRNGMKGHVAQHITEESGGSDVCPGERMGLKTSCSSIYESALDVTEHSNENNTIGLNGSNEPITLGYHANDHQSAVSTKVTNKHTCVDEDETAQVKDSQSWHSPLKACSKTQREYHRDQGIEFVIGNNGNDSTSETGSCSDARPNHMASSREALFVKKSDDQLANMSNKCEAGGVASYNRRVMMNNNQCEHSVMAAESVERPCDLLSKLKDDHEMDDVTWRSFNYPYINMTMSGGGVKCYCYIGALAALYDAGVLDRVRRVSGSSAGAICGGLLAVGCNPQEIADIFAGDIKWLFHVHGWLLCPQALSDVGVDTRRIKKVAGSSVGAIVAGLLAVGSTPQEVSDVFSVDIKWLFLDQKCACCCCLPMLCSQYGVHPAKRFLHIYGQHIANKVGNPDITFGELYHKYGRELCIVVTNLSKMCSEYCHAKTTPDLPIRQAVRMSMSFPMVYQAVKANINGVESLYTDGGTLDQYPVHCFDGPELELNHNSETDSGRTSQADSTINEKTLGLYVVSESAIDYKIWKALFGADIPYKPSYLPDTKLARQRLEEEFQRRCRKNKDLSMKDLKNDEIMDRERTKFLTELKAERSNHEEPMFHYETCDKSTVDIRSFKQYFITTIETLLISQRRLHIKPEDVKRTIAINCGYIGTNDYVIEPGDREFMIRQGYECTRRFLQEYIAKHRSTAPRRTSHAYSPTSNYNNPWDTIQEGDPRSLDQVEAQVHEYNVQLNGLQHEHVEPKHSPDSGVVRKNTCDSSDAPSVHFGLDDETPITKVAMRSQLNGALPHTGNGEHFVKKNVNGIVHRRPNSIELQLDSIPYIDADAASNLDISMEKKEVELRKTYKQMNGGPKMHRSGSSIETIV